MKQNVLAGLFDKAKRKILGKELREGEVGAAGGGFAQTYPEEMPVGSLAFDAAGIDPTLWEPQELGKSTAEIEDCDVDPNSERSRSCLHCVFTRRWFVIRSYAKPHRRVQACARRAHRPLRGGNEQAAHPPRQTAESRRADRPEQEERWEAQAKKGS